MVTNGDIIQVIDKQTYSPSLFPLENVYHFQVSALSGVFTFPLDGVQFGTWFYASYLAEVLDCQSSAVNHAVLKMSNLMDYIVDFSEYSSTVIPVGHQTVPFLSFQDAFSIELLRTTRATRNGSKRIGGVPETFSDNGQIVAGFLPTVINMANKLGATVTYEPIPGFPIMDLTPVILKSPVLPPIVPTVINPVRGGLFKGLGSQNTRKHLS